MQRRNHRGDRRLHSLCSALLILTTLLAAGAVQATPSATGYQTTSILTPGRAVGDIVVVGDAVFVGVGDFGVGTMSVVRIDSGGTTVLADGFNALAGFAYDPISGRLIVGDNAGDLLGAITGDTIYAIDDPFGSPVTPASAVSLELLPMGTIPGTFDLVFDPTDLTGNTLFVTDASEFFPIPDGRLLEVSISSGTTSVLHSGLAFAAGLATDADTLYVGETLLDFSGAVSTVSLADPGAALTPLASGLGGQFDLEIAADGTIFSSSGGEISLVFGDGSSATFASPFGFAASLEVSDGVIYALDGFSASGDENRIWVFTPVPEPGTALLLSLGLGVLSMRRRTS